MLLRWMAAEPEIARLVNEFDEHNDKHDGKHHEQSAAVQAEVRKDVCELTGIVRCMAKRNMTHLCRRDLSCVRNR